MFRDIEIKLIDARSITLGQLQDWFAEWKDIGVDVYEEYAMYVSFEGIIQLYELDDQQYESITNWLCTHEDIMTFDFIDMGE